MESQIESELDWLLPQLPAGVKMVSVNDGARGIASYVGTCKQLAGATVILDYHHACEHLSLLGESLFGKSSPKGKKWYKKYRGKLLTDAKGVEELLRSVAYYEKQFASRLSKTRKAELALQRGFFERNHDRMRYADYRQRGLPIGSGPVESACKTIVKARLCGSGMRWNRINGQRILNIRTLVKSKRWDTAWNTYTNNPT